MVELNKINFYFDNHIIPLFLQVLREGKEGLSFEDLLNYFLCGVDKSYFDKESRLNAIKFCSSILNDCVNEGYLVEVSPKDRKHNSSRRRVVYKIPLKIILKYKE